LGKRDFEGMTLRKWSRNIASSTNIDGSTHDTNGNIGSRKTTTTRTMTIDSTSKSEAIAKEERQKKRCCRSKD